MWRLMAFVLTTAFFLAGTPASACAPPMIAFATGSARLNANDLRAIAEVAAEFRRTPSGSRLRLSAGTDGVGPLDRNRRLAQRRGDVVRAALVRRGIPGDAIDIELDPRTSGSPYGGLRIVQIDLVEGPSGCW